jgi:hypothetical protein
VQEVVAEGADVANGRDPHAEHSPQAAGNEVVLDLGRDRLLALQGPRHVEVGDVDVGVHQARHERLAAQIDTCGVHRLVVAARVHGGDASLLEDHRGVLARRRAGAVDHPGACQADAVCHGRG